MSAVGKVQDQKDEGDQLFSDVVDQQAQDGQGESQQGEQEANDRATQDSAGACLMRLSGMADVEVAAKQQVENRWLVDLAQFHGKYDDLTFKKIREAGGSELFANQTRPKTTAWAARFGDMLFPTDDKNWGITPTPIPTMAGGDAAQRAQAAAKNATMANAQGDKAAEAQHIQSGFQAANDSAQQAAESDAAKAKCEQMEKLMDDQLTESNYNIVSRESILDACKLGTGIIKGPVLGTKTRRSWRQMAKNIFGLKDAEDPRPSYDRVDPWSFFPDSSVASILDAEYTFERHLPNKRELRKWKKRPGFIAANIDKLLLTEPGANIPTYVNLLRVITGIDNIAGDKNYLVWEYHGAVTKEEMLAICEGQNDQQMMQIVNGWPEDEMQVILWFSSDAILLRYGLHPLESGDTLYSLFNFDKDETSVWGYGVPFLMRDPQAAFSAAWRMMMDNGALSSGPQIIVNKANIEPENGDWKLVPRKVWLRKQDSMSNMQPDFQVEEITCNQSDLINILTTAKTFIDDETLLPPIAYGESGSHITKTAQGISMLMNAVNVIFRFVVKNWDDQITVPNIQRLYDWNMQFYPSEDVKGDFDVQARGSSVLLVREIQSQNLMTLAANYATHPIFGPMIKVVPLFRKLVASFLITPDEVVKDDDTYKKDVMAAAKAAQNAPNPELDAKVKLLQMSHQFKMQELEAQARMLLAQTAAEGNIKIDVVRAQLQSKERLFAGEAAMTPADTHGGGGDL